MDEHRAIPMVGHAESLPGQTNDCDGGGGLSGHNELRYDLEPASIHGLSSVHVTAEELRLDGDHWRGVTVMPWLMGGHHRGQGLVQDDKLAGAALGQSYALARMSGGLLIWMEARAGIEPTYADLQSAASPLCHRARAGPMLTRHPMVPTSDCGHHNTSTQAHPAPCCLAARKANPGRKPGLR